MIKRAMVKEILSWGFIILVAFLLAFLINSRAYGNVRVEQSSMNNTLHDGQRLIVDELSYNFTKPQRGEIITFYRYEKKGTLLNDFDRYINSIEARLKDTEPDEEHERLIKRVIGIEGDVIEIKDGAVYRNGKKLEEPYVAGETSDKGLASPVTVGKNELFVMGDNRSVSIDSREIGMVKISHVEGKAIFRVYPFKKLGKIK